jgi:hypothetical protein
LQSQLGPEPFQVTVELVTHLVLQLQPQQRPETLEVVVQLVAHLVLELAWQLAPYALDLGPEILEVGLQDGCGCLA